MTPGSFSKVAPLDVSEYDFANDWFFAEEKRFFEEMFDYFLETVEMNDYYESNIEKTYAWYESHMEKYGTISWYGEKFLEEKFNRIFGV